jgi:hypothetical protein
LTDERQHSSVFDVRSYRGDDCDTDHYLLVIKVRDILPVSKRAAHTFHIERFNIKNLKVVEVKGQYQGKSQTGFQALKN